MSTTDQAAGLFGIPLPQVAAFLLTIIAAYFSARFGSAENRRQFEEKAKGENRAAASELVSLLMKFALECGRQWSALQEQSTDQLARQIDTVTFPSGIHAVAAKLGALTTEQAIKLELLTDRVVRTSISYANGDPECGRDPEVQIDELRGSFALLDLRARLLVDVAAEQRGLGCARTH
jgi:hypothetical protein